MTRTALRFGLLGATVVLVSAACVNILGDFTITSSTSGTGGHATTSSTGGSGTTTSGTGGTSAITSSSSSTGTGGTGNTCAGIDAGATCSASSCTDGMLTSAGTCDDAGACSTTMTSCAPYACGDAGCGMSCTDDSQCLAVPCNVCLDPQQVCLVPLAPIAGFPTENSCKTMLTACDTSTAKMCQPINTFSVGTKPIGIAFDGTNMWVANNSSNDVTELSLSGAVLGTPMLLFAPYAIAFDGSAIWVAGAAASGGHGAVTRLDLTGAPVTGFPVMLDAGGSATGLAFDGTYMWVAENDGTVVALNPDGTLYASSNGLDGGSSALDSGLSGGLSAIAFDGKHMWVTNGDDSYVQELSVVDGTISVMVTVTLATMAEPFGLASDGSNMWVTGVLSGDGGAVTKISVTSGMTVGPPIPLTALPSHNVEPKGIAFDGTNMWVAGLGDGVVTKLAPNGEQTLFTVGPPSCDPHFLAFDGTHMWVTLQGSGQVAEL